MKKILINGIIFIIVFFLSLYLSYSLDGSKKKDNKKTHRPKTVKSKPKKIKKLKGAGKINGRKVFLITANAVASLLIALAFGFGGIMQERYEILIDWLSDEVKIDIFIQNTQNFERKLQKLILKNVTEELQEFPFSTEFSEMHVLKIPVLDESEEYTVDIPVEIHEYRSDKVPLNEDIHGFIVNDTYYCNEDDSETSIVKYNYYNLEDCWLTLHTVEVNFTGREDFEPHLNGTTIMLREKRSQKAVILEDSYQEDVPVIFECSTGEYVLEIYKGRMIYTSSIFIDKSDKMMIGIGEKDHYYLSSVFSHSFRNFFCRSQCVQSNAQAAISGT